MRIADKASANGGEPAQQWAQNNTAPQGTAPQVRGTTRDDAEGRGPHSHRTTGAALSRSESGGRRCSPQGRGLGGEQGKVPLTQLPALGLTGDPAGWHCARVQEGPGSRRQCREAGLTAVPGTQYVLKMQKGR